MVQLPESVNRAWKKRKGPVVFSTVDQNGLPNAIYATCVRMRDQETVIIADNFFDKTKQNIFSGSRGSILFITEEDEAFQLKGSIEYHQDGSFFEEMKEWNPKDLPGHAAALVKIEEIYSGSERIK